MNDSIEILCNEVKKFSEEMIKKRDINMDNMINNKKKSNEEIKESTEEKKKSTEEKK